MLQMYTFFKNKRICTKKTRATRFVALAIASGFPYVLSNATVKPQILFSQGMYLYYHNLKERIYNSDFLEYCRKSSTLENFIGTSKHFFDRRGRKSPSTTKKMHALKLSVFLEWQQPKCYHKIFILSHPRKIKEIGSKNIIFLLQKKQ
jgi:hypothetical protein